MTPVSAAQYSRLLDFRTELRRFLRWSESQAKAAGLTPAQHQLLLAVKGHRDGDPTVGEIAEYLLLRHHSTVELLDRACRAGLVERHTDPADARLARARLTAIGEQKLEQLSWLTMEELRRLGPVLVALHDSDA